MLVRRISFDEEVFRVSKLAALRGASAVFAALAATLGGCGSSGATSATSTGGASSGGVSSSDAAIGGAPGAGGSGAAAALPGSAGGTSTGASPGTGGLAGSGGTATPNAGTSGAGLGTSSGASGGVAQGTTGGAATAGGSDGSGVSGGTGGVTTGGAAGAAASAGSPESGTGGALPQVDLSPHSYEPDNAYIQYSGRIDFTNAKRPKFSAPGISVRARFVGDAVSVSLADEFKWDKERNWYEVVLDGETLPKLGIEEAETEYEVATGLAYGEHTLVLSKRTESSIGYGEFLGLAVNGELVEPPAKPSRRIIFIGDSISVGAGIEAAKDSSPCSEDAWGKTGTSGWGQPYHNAYLAFGPVLARELDAEYHVEAVSGIGLVRNYSDSSDARTMPEVYDLLFLEQTNSPVWQHSRFVPDAVVIALGTNDFSPGDTERDPALDLDDYTSAYIDFIDTLRSDYPNAHIFCLSSPMLSDGWPDAQDKSATNLKTALTMVSDHYAADTASRVHTLEVTKVDGGGCGGHPDVAEHAALAAKLESVIKEQLGW